jgi:hypothetical protein
MFLGTRPPDWPQVSLNPLRWRRPPVSPEAAKTDNLETHGDLARGALENVLY